MSNSKLLLLRRKIQILMFDLFSVEFVSKLYFRLSLGYRLDLNNPQTLNAKIQWLKIYEWPKNQLVIQCTDKYQVRKFIESQGLKQYLNQLYGVWNSPDDINWESLPSKYVLKVSNGCGYNIICDKSDIDKKTVTRQLKKWQKEQFGKVKAEPHYNVLKSKIICEKFLDKNLIDYKFFCLNGKVKFMYISQGSNGPEEMETFFDKDGQRLPFKRSDFRTYEKATLPNNFKKMSQLSELLASAFPLVRVDWYEVENRIYFGELTFTPGGGLIRFNPIKYDELYGKELDLSTLMGECKN